MKLYYGSWGGCDWQRFESLQWTDHEQLLIQFQKGLIRRPPIIVSEGFTAEQIATMKMMLYAIDIYEKTEHGILGCGPVRDRWLSRYILELEREKK